MRMNGTNTITLRLHTFHKICLQRENGAGTLYQRVPLQKSTDF